MGFSIVIATIATALGTGDTWLYVGGDGQGRCTQNDTRCQMHQVQMQQQMLGQRMGMMQMMMGHMSQDQSTEAPKSNGQ